MLPDQHKQLHCAVDQVGGHGNVGSKQDFQFQLAFLTDLRNTTLEERKAEAFSSHMKPTENNHAAFAARSAMRSSSA